MRDFREIKVWEKAHLLTLKIYKATASFPTEERYGLTSQLRRSSASIAANIAEGFGRGETQSWRVSFRSEWDLRARSSIISS